MKASITGFFVLAALLAGGFWFYSETRHRAEAQTRVMAAEEKLRQTEAAAVEEEKRNQREQARLAEANAQLAEKARQASAQASALASNLTVANPVTEKKESGFPALFKDPDMKEAMRKQGRDAIARQLKELLTTNFLQQLGLDREKAGALKELLSHRMTLAFDFMMPVMTGELDEASLAEFGRQTKAGLAELEQQIKNVLGEEGYKTLQERELSQPDREQVKKFAARLAEDGHALEQEQQNQLVSAISEERRNFPFSVDYNDTSKIDFEHFREFYSEERLNKYFSELEQLNQRIVQRIQGILPSAQAGEFESALKNQLQQGKFVVRTTHEMLGRGSAK